MDALSAQAPPTTVHTASAFDSGVAVDAPRPKTERIAYIDMARGLFLILMASTHAMTLAGIPATSPLADWGLPRGWATTGPIMLCGFMVATFARQMQERARIRHRVLRRAKQVLLVMFASNVLMVVVKRVVTHETDPLFSLDWVGRSVILSIRIVDLWRLAADRAVTARLAVARCALRWMPIEGVRGHVDRGALVLCRADVERAVPCRRWARDPSGAERDVRGRRRRLPGHPDGRIRSARLPRGHRVASAAGAPRRARRSAS